MCRIIDQYAGWLDLPLHIGWQTCRLNLAVHQSGGRASVESLRPGGEQRGESGNGKHIFIRNKHLQHSLGIPVKKKLQSRLLIY
jgi:hypothetical protein